MKVFDRTRHWRKRIISAALIAGFMVAMGNQSAATKEMQVFATTAKEIKEQAETDLENTNDKINELENEQAYVSSKITKTAAELDQIIAEQKELQTDIENKQQEVEQTNEELTAAQEKEQEQYESMKLRIQFMYENNADDSLWSAIFESSGLADMLTKIEYISDVYRSDRELMDAYEQTVQEVEDKTVQLAEDMDALLALQDEYEQKQDVLEEKLASLEDQKEEFAQQIANAKELAASYQETISVQGEIIRQQEAAAAAAAAAEEERRRRQEEEEQNRQQQVAAGSTTGNTTASSSGSTSSGTTIDPNTYEGGGTGASGLGSADYLTDPSADPDYTTGVSGSELVAYALQFVGNPYVWGGNSLTNGCDCSGFVHLVYQNFGISTPRYSQSFKTWGEPVAYENIKAGDVVVYPGHVAIYIGNGCIVEAQSTKAGITSYRSVNCHTITAIRRGL